MKEEWLRDRLKDALALAVAAQTYADRTFDGLVNRALQGEKNLELAAATAAGMSHAAREIANSIRVLQQEQTDD
jgi:hypothetical protein